MELGFLLSLTGVLGGIWVYLLNLILERTVADPADHSLLAMGYMHYIVLTYLVLALYVFYNKGRERIDRGTIPARVDVGTARRVRISINIILETWPVTAMILVLSFVSAKIGPAKYFLDAAQFLLVLVALGALFYRMVKGNRLSTGLQASHLLWLWGSMVPGGMVYIMVMSFILADVRITTDKEFYQQHDPVLVSVRSAGYILRPSTRKILFGQYSRDHIGDETVLVKPEEHIGNDLISIDFFPQILEVKRSAYRYVKMVKDK